MRHIVIPADQGFWLSHVVLPSNYYVSPVVAWWHLEGSDHLEPVVRNPDGVIVHAEFAVITRVGDLPRLEDLEDAAKRRLRTYWWESSSPGWSYGDPADAIHAILTGLVSEGRVIVPEARKTIRHH